MKKKKTVFIIATMLVIIIYFSNNWFSYTTASVTLPRGQSSFLHLLCDLQSMSSEKKFEYIEVLRKEVAKTIYNSLHKDGLENSPTTYVCFNEKKMEVKVISNWAELGFKPNIQQEGLIHIKFNKKTGIADISFNGPKALLQKEMVFDN